MIQKIAHISEFQENRIIAKTLNGKYLALVKIKDKIFAFDDECPHQQNPLSTSILDPEKKTIECIYHGARFNLQNGKVLDLPATHPLRTYKTETKNEEVFIEI